MTGFLGPNGAGKTTTLRMILALARPTAGQRDGPRPPVREARRAGAHGRREPGDRGRPSRPQGARPPARAGGDGAGSRARAWTRCCGSSSSTGAADRRAGKYSLGMRQRLGLAATLLGDPQILVLDEPANGLDPQGIRWLRDFLRGMAAEGRTVLVSSHVLAEVAQTVDDVVVIHRGKLVEQGPVGAADRRRPRRRALAAGRRAARGARGAPGLGVTGRGRRAGGRRRGSRPGRRHRVRGRRAAARADHARDLARGGVPRADHRPPAEPPA